MSLPAIQVENLSKLYHIGRRQERNDTLRDALAGTFHRFTRAAKRAKDDESDLIWALKDISFEVAPGEVLGVIGRNGAGKSTLLKVLSKITEPTSGRIVINGRVGSLLEVGTGFHPELTGHENIYLNGAILGMTRVEIERKFDEIVDFSEIEKFLDTPVKRYSSGMYVRLAFAVAANLEPEILLVDEVLAVGDAAFQKKCIGKMDEVSKGGRTIVFVSHNLGVLESLCPTSILIHAGTLSYLGNTKFCIQKYLESTTDQKVGSFTADIQQNHSKFKLHSVRTCNQQGETCKTFRADQEITVHFIYEIYEKFDGFRIMLRVLDHFNTVLFSSSDIDENYDLINQRNPGKFETFCVIPKYFLNKGVYKISISADIPMKEWVIENQTIITFTVDQAGAIGAMFSDNRLGIFRPLLNWTTTQIDI